MRPMRRPVSQGVAHVAGGEDLLGENQLSVLTILLVGRIRDRRALDGVADEHVIKLAGPHAKIVISDGDHCITSMV